MKTRFLFGLLALILSSGILFAGNDGWTLYKSVDGVQIYSKEMPCNASKDQTPKNENQELLVFKFVNTTANNITVSWDFDVWYGSKCRTCNLDISQKKDYVHSISIKAHKTVEGTCSDNLASGLMLLSGVQHKANQKKLAKFEMNNLVVSVSKK